MFHNDNNNHPQSYIMYDVHREGRRTGWFVASWFSGPTPRRVAVVSSTDIPRPTRLFIIILRIRASELFFTRILFIYFLVGFFFFKSLRSGAHTHNAL